MKIKLEEKMGSNHAPATIGKAKELNENYEQILGTIGDYIDETGQKWNIEINIRYSDDNVANLNSTLSSYMDEFKKGDLITLDHEAADQQKKDNITKNIKNFIEGDIIMFIGAQGNYTGTGGWISLIGSAGTSTYFHEAMHALGFFGEFPDLDQIEGSMYSKKIEIQQGASSVKDIKNYIIHPYRYNQIVNFALINSSKLFNACEQYFSGRINKIQTQHVGNEAIKKEEKKSIIKKILNWIKAPKAKYGLKPIKPKPPTPKK